MIKFIKFIKLMINKIFLEFMIFDKTIDFVKVLTDDKIYKTIDE
jgi:hypothetical protein